MATLRDGSGQRPVGLILAGGQARRLGGGDKGLRLLAGRPLLAWIVERLSPLCDGLLISANGDPSRFAALGLPVIADHAEDRGHGPLAGVLAGLDAVAARRPDEPLVLTVPGDTPFLPSDLVCRLVETCGQSPHGVAAARSGELNHPVVALWPVGLRHSLRQELREGTRLGVGGMLTKFGAAWANWPTDPVDPFHNINTPEDLALAERLL